MLPTYLLGSEVWFALAFGVMSDSIYRNSYFIYRGCSFSAVDLGGLTIMQVISGRGTS